MPLSSLVHDRAGAGDPVVLIHGIGHRRQAWRPVFERLAEEHEVIALDLSGFGESAPYPRGERYSMDTACRDLAANFEQWGVEAPHVVGNSLGGAISLELAARGLVSSATVLSPAGFFGPIDRTWALSALLGLWGASHAPEPVLRTLTRSALARHAIGYLLYKETGRHDAETTLGDAVAMRRARAFLPTLRAGVTYELDASSISVPVTVAWGEHDRLLPYRQAAVARERLPMAHHVPLPGCGHVPMTDDPDLVAGLIAQTVGRARAARAA